MDQRLGGESHVELPPSPHPQAHETEEVSAVDEQELLLPQAGKTKSSMCSLSFTNYQLDHEDEPEEPSSVASQFEPHGSGAGDYDEISGVNEQGHLLSQSGKVQTPRCWLLPTNY
jgi:hypothetical protein